MKPIVEHVPVIEGTGPSARPFWSLRVLGAERTRVCMNAPVILERELAKIRAPIKRALARAGIEFQVYGGFGLNTSHDMWIEEWNASGRAVPFGRAVRKSPILPPDRIYDQIVHVTAVFVAAEEVTT